MCTFLILTIQSVLKITTLYLTSGKAYQEQQLFYVKFFQTVVFFFNFKFPINLRVFLTKLVLHCLSKKKRT